MQVHIALDLAWNSHIACSSDGPLCFAGVGQSELSSLALPSAISRHLLLRALPHALMLSLWLVVSSIFLENMRADSAEQQGSEASFAWVSCMERL